jgi:hypothetical protein
MRIWSGLSNLSKKPSTPEAAKQEYQSKTFTCSQAQVGDGNMAKPNLRGQAKSQSTKPNEPIQSKNLLYYGREGSLPARQSVNAGPFSLVFEEGCLRHLRIGGREVVRGIYVAVRDRNWGTVASRIFNVQTRIKPDSFTIAFEAEHRQAEIDYYWRGRFEGTRHGTIHVSMEGQARSTFLKSRIGFCVLHPANECVGAPFLVERVSGEQVAGCFPELICPTVPVPDMEEMRALSYTIPGGPRVKFTFSGDIFETEDQRNWTDASFKTFSTPTRLPYPLEIPSGTEVCQSITLTIEEQVPASRVASSGREIIISLEPRIRGKLPRIGLGVCSDLETLNQQEITRLRAMNLAHLRVDLVPWESEPNHVMAQATSEVHAIGAELEVALFLSENPENELRHLSKLLAEYRAPVCTWLIFSRKESVTPPYLVRLAAESLRQCTPEAKLGAGTDAWFYELNSTRPAYTGIDLLCYSIQPQAHVSDNDSLIETLEIQGETVLNARKLDQSLQVAVSPVTLKARFNPYATVSEKLIPHELPPQVDPRQMSLFGAGWTLGSLKHLAEAGAHRVTYFETVGWRGVMEREHGCALPEKFPSRPGEVFPLYHVLAEIGEYSGGDWFLARSSQPDQVSVVAARNGNKSGLIVANLSPQPQRISLPTLPGHATITILDEHSIAEACKHPETFRVFWNKQGSIGGAETRVELLPFALAFVRVDGEAILK